MVHHGINIQFRHAGESEVSHGLLMWSRLSVCSMGQSISTCICAPACLGNLVTKRLTSGAPVKAQGCGDRMPSTIERVSTHTFLWSQYSRVMAKP